MFDSSPPSHHDQLCSPEEQVTLGLSIEQGKWIDLIRVHRRQMKAIELIRRRTNERTNGEERKGFIRKFDAQSTDEIYFEWMLTFFCLVQPSKVRDDVVWTNEYVHWIQIEWKDRQTVSCSNRTSARLNTHIVFHRRQSSDEFHSMTRECEETSK